MDKDTVEVDAVPAHWYSMMHGGGESIIDRASAVSNAEKADRSLPSSINPIIIDVVLVLFACLAFLCFFHAAQQSCLFSYRALTPSALCPGSHISGSDFLSFGMLAAAPAALMIGIGRVARKLKRRR